MNQETIDSRAGRVVIAEVPSGTDDMTLYSIAKFYAPNWASTPEERKPILKRTSVILVPEVGGPVVRDLNRTKSLEEVAFLWPVPQVPAV